MNFWPGMVWSGGARSGDARRGRDFLFRFGVAVRQGLVGSGTAWHGEAGRGTAGIFYRLQFGRGAARRGVVRLCVVAQGAARLGGARQGRDFFISFLRRGLARCGRVWLGRARRGAVRHREVRRGGVRHGEAGIFYRLQKFGAAWSGMVWHGEVRHGEARSGVAARGKARQGDFEMKLALSKIVIDETIYPRSGVSDFNVNKLVAALKTGVRLPPLTVEARTRRLVDGRHRLAAYTAQKAKTCDVIEKVYASEADLFADAVRLNIGHGQPLDQYSVRSAIIRLTEYGYHREKISDVVRLPVDQIEKIERGFATDDATGKPVALKGGLDHLARQPLNQSQLALNRHYSGPKATFYVNQLCEMIECNGWPNQSAGFHRAMNRLVKLWQPYMAGDEVPLAPEVSSEKAMT